MLSSNGDYRKLGLPRFSGSVQLLVMTFDGKEGKEGDLVQNEAWTYGNHLHPFYLDARHIA